MDSSNTASDHERDRDSIGSEEVVEVVEVEVVDVVDIEGTIFAEA